MRNSAELEDQGSQASAALQRVSEIFTAAVLSYGKSLIFPGDIPMLDFAARSEGHT